MKKECADIQTLLSAYVDNETSTEQSSYVLDHISHCESCKNQIANIYKMKDMVKSSFTPKDDVDLSKNIMANIRANNKYVKKVNVNNKKTTSISKTIVNKMLYISAVACILVAVIGATVMYFEKNSAVPVDVAAKAYEKYDSYVMEHYANSYAAPAAQASVISVNFEK